MGSANSRLNQSDIKIDDRLSQHNTNHEKQPGENNMIGGLIAEKAHIILSINNDNTVRIAAAKSCATQTDGTGDNNQGLEVMTQLSENSSAPIETKENQDVPTEAIEIEAKSRLENQGKETEPPSDDVAKSPTNEEETPMYTETDNDAEYSTDLGFRTEDDIENEQTEAKEPLGDSTMTLEEAVKDTHQNDDSKEESYDMMHDDNEDTDQARPFAEVTLEKYGKYKIRMSDDQKNCIASSTAFLTTGDVVIIDRSNQKIKFVDKQFQFISALELSAKPWAVCTRGTDVYVTMGNTQIQHLVVEDMIIKPSKVFEVKGRCLGVCMLDKHIAVGLQIGEISLLDFKGIHKGNITLPLIDKKPCNPWHLCSTPENNILVADSDAGVVYCVNQKSELIFEYSGIDTPRATALDNEGNILVAGRDKQSGDVVTLIDKDVELKCMLHMQHEYKPNIESKTLMRWEELEFVPYSVCYRRDRIIVFGGIQETLKIMKLR